MRPLVAIPQEMFPETLGLIAKRRVGPLPAQRKAFDGHVLNDNGWLEEPALIEKNWPNWVSVPTLGKSLAACVPVCCYQNIGNTRTLLLEASDEGLRKKIWNNYRRHSSSSVWHSALFQPEQFISLPSIG